MADKEREDNQKMLDIKSDQRCPLIVGLKNRDQGSLLYYNTLFLNVGYFFIHYFEFSQNSEKSKIMVAYILDL